MESLLLLLVVVAAFPCFPCVGVGVGVQWVSGKELQPLPLTFNLPLQYAPHHNRHNSNSS